MRSVSCVFNNNDQLISETSSTKGQTAYTYDANGSMTGKVSDSGDSYIYTYNLQNRLSTATIARTEGTSLVDITSAYVYNQSGIRVGASTSTKIDGGPAETKNTTYLVDPANFTGYAQVLEQFDDGVLAKSYTLGDDVLAQTVGTTTSYLQYDGHGSTRLLTSATSAIANRFDYDAYGKSVGFVSNVTSPAATDMLYSGEQFDPNLQMQYLRARYYDQNNGRFNRLDPFGGNNQDPQSLHKYAYCHGNPVRYFDPSGNFPVSSALKALFKKIGSWLISMLILTGIAAHKRLGQEYKKASLNPGSVYTNVPFFAVFGISILSVPGSRKRPDILDLGTSEIYEIKSIFTNTVAQAIKLARSQLDDYQSIIEEILKTDFVSTGFGATGTINPGVSWSPLSSYLLTPEDFYYLPMHVRIFAFRVEPGVIVYTPGPEVLVYATAAELAHRSFQVYSHNMSRLNQQVGHASVFALMGWI